MNSAAPQPQIRQRAFDTRQLFGNVREILIAHDGKEYRLRITRNSKLILTK